MTASLPFEVQFFHPGLFYDRIVDDQRGRRAAASSRSPFSPGLFDYGKNVFNDPMPADLGFAGFRVHYPLNRADYLDELVVFLGASYFRSLGKGQILRPVVARAVDRHRRCRAGEEFPVFRSFWIEQPP